MTITAREMEIYRQRDRTRRKVQQQQLEERRQRALGTAGAAAVILRREFGASRVVLFGSVLQPGMFHSRSDIDLAVWGVEHYFRAAARLMDLEGGFSFDLVPFEDARPAIRNVIEQEGIDI